MDWLQRKIKKEMEKNRPDFDEWFEQNREVFSKFEKFDGAAKKGSVFVKTRKIWLPVIALLGCVIICLSIILPIVFSGTSNDFDFSFSDEDVYASTLTESEIQDLNEKYSFVQKMQVTSMEGLRLNSDDSLVMAVLNGEVGTEDNYYFLTLQIEYNHNYLFGYKSEYEGLSNAQQISGWDITYGQTIIDFDGLYVYLIRLENVQGQVVYIEAHCFENDISYIINDFIAD